MNGIIYKDRAFSEPVVLGSAPLARTQGVYAILVPDALWSPWQFRAIYFGETDNLAKNATPQHEKFNEWLREANGSTLYVAVHSTAKMKAQKRKDAENELVAEFHPPCNEALSLSLA